MIQRRDLALISIVVCMAVCCTGSGVAGEKEKKIGKKDLPASVLSAFEKRYPKATIKGLSKEEEDGRTLYEIESVEGKVRRDITYSPEGTMVELEQAMAASALPSAVKAAVYKQYPKGKIVKAEEVTRDTVVNYEMHIVTGKTKHELVVDPAGKIVEKEEKQKED